MRPQRGSWRACDAAGLAALFLLAITRLHAAESALPEPFVHLSDVAPTIRQDIRYAGAGNFMGRAVDGYAKPACILTEKAARALAGAQSDLAGQSLTLVVFDCFRPARAVADMVAWTKAGGSLDPQWSPHVARADLIANGYIGAQSAHSRGSTVDIALEPAEEQSRQDNACGLRGADTLDFGAGFDCFDPVSNTAAKSISVAASANRQKLLAIMQRAGFRNYDKEWWHFTLRDEPFPKQRFDFPVE